MLVYCLHGLCTFPYMVCNVNITTKSGIIRRKEEACCRQMLTMLGHCLYGLCPFPYMVINANIVRKSRKMRRKRIDMMQLFLIMLRQCLHSLCAFTSPLSLQRDSFITPDLDDFFSALTLNLAFLPRKLMVSHTQELLQSLSRVCSLLSMFWQLRLQSFTDHVNHLVMARILTQKGHHWLTAHYISAASLLLVSSVASFLCAEIFVCSQYHIV